MLINLNALRFNDNTKNSSHIRSSAWLLCCSICFCFHSEHDLKDIKTIRLVKYSQTNINRHIKTICVYKNMLNLLSHDINFKTFRKSAGLWSAFVPLCVL